MEEKAKLTAWEVSDKVDYDRMMKEFGAESLAQDVLTELEEVASARGIKLHPFLRRQVYYCHRGLRAFLEAYRKNPDSVFLYTGRGPSHDMHLGHCVPFAFTRWLQQLFDCWVVIQIADEEKYIFRKENDNRDMLAFYQLGFDNSEDIVSFGFDERKTFIFSNAD